MAYSTILTETRGRVGLVTLNRPQAMNAFNMIMLDELFDALEAFDKDENVGAMVVTGNEKAFAAGALDPAYMGLGPIPATRRVLGNLGLSLKDIDLIELNEAFASQSIACMRELGLDPEKVNVNGGAIALGHPLGASGAKLTVQLIHEMKSRQIQFGMVTMCIGGGMGAAGIFENLA